jgi:signal peptidase I
MPCGAEQRIRQAADIVHFKQKNCEYYCTRVKNKRKHVRQLKFPCVKRLQVVKLFIMDTRSDSFFSEMVRFALITLAIVLPVRFFVAEPFIVSGASMEPTFETGQYLIIDRLTYRFEEPKRGEVIIFKYPENPSKYFIKRIVGLPNETVQIKNGVVSIVNKGHPEGFTLDQTFILYPKEDSGTYPLGENQYFVMGDNRGASSDSRAWGSLPENLIVGRAFLRLFPPQTVSILPGDHSN